MIAQQLPTIKHLLLASLLMCFGSTLLAQSAAEMSYSDVYMGRNFNMVYKRQLNRWAPYAGLGYFVNRIDRIPSGVFVKKGGFAGTIKERLGLRFGTEFDVFRNDYCRIGLFCEGQVYKTSAKFRPSYSSDSSNYSEMRDFGPVLSIDNVLGISINARLTEQFYMNLKGGIGAHLLRGYTALAISPARFLISAESTFSVGLGYVFKRKPKRESK